MLKTMILFHEKNRFFAIIWLVLPLLLAFIVCATFYNKTPTKLPTLVIDNDRTISSFDLKFMLSSSPVLDIHYISSLHEAQKLLNKGDFFATLIIPDNFESNIKLGVGAEVALYYNTQFVLIGKAINAAVVEVLSNAHTQYLVAQNIIKSSNFNIALGESLPIIPHINALYNEGSNYAQFLVTLILPCLWQILVALGMLSLLRHYAPLKSLVINCSFSLFWGCGMFFLFSMLDFVFLGSVWIVIIALAILALVLSGIVIFFYALLHDFVRTSSAIAVYTAPSLAFAGVTYPLNSMPSFAQFYSELLPISYFMRIYIQQSSNDGSFYELWQQSFNDMVLMLPFGLFLIFGLLWEKVLTR